MRSFWRPTNRNKLGVLSQLAGLKFRAQGAEFRVSAQSLGFHIRVETDRQTQRERERE